jgi:hypothetical protein
MSEYSLFGCMTWEEEEAGRMQQAAGVAATACSRFAYPQIPADFFVRLFFVRIKLAEQDVDTRKER